MSVVSSRCPDVRAYPKPELRALRCVCGMGLQPFSTNPVRQGRVKLKPHLDGAGSRVRGVPILGPEKGAASSPRRVQGRSRVLGGFVGLTFLRCIRWGTGTVWESCMVEPGPCASMQHPFALETRRIREGWISLHVACFPDTSSNVSAADCQSPDPGLDGPLV